MSAAQIEEAIAQLKDINFSIRRGDRTKLGDIADAAAIATIIALLNDDDWRVRSRAEEALGEIGDASAVSMLVETMQDQTDSGADFNMHRVHDCAAKALGKIGDATAILALKAMLGSKEFTVRLRAAKALLEAKHVLAVPVLLQMLHTLDVSERLSILHALADAGDAFATPPLLAILTGDDIAPVQVAAAAALLELGDSLTLPRKILICSRFTAHERIELLYALRRVRYTGGTPDVVIIKYSFPDVRTLCHQVMIEQEEKACAEARKVLNWINGDRDLLIASERPPTNESDILLRAAQGSSHETRSDTLLRASDAPSEER